MRDPRYEISILGQNGENPIYLEDTIKTSDAIRKIYERVITLQNTEQEKPKDKTTDEQPITPDSPLIRRATRSSSAGPPRANSAPELSLTNTYTYGEHQISELSISLPEGI